MKPEDLGTYYESILDQEVRREGGIYYTPPLIVDYMVENALGELLKSKKPEEAAGVKIVDPACGGGVFLLRVYQFLLDWHEKRSGKLTLENRRKILTDNIFGIDIDPIAVEITKYCLSMKCSDGKDFSLDLNENIRCGNSLVETEFYWRKEFPCIFIQGGFDIVIGNPPYIGEDSHKFIFEPYKKSPLGERFYKGKMDLFYFFFHAGLDLLKEDGILTFITTNYYLTADGAIKLREDLYKRSEIIELVNFNELKVFESALGQHNAITLLRRSSAPKNTITKQFLTKNRGKASPDVLKRILSGKDDATEYTTITRDKLFDGEKKYIRFSAGNGIDSILDKVADKGRPLGLSFRTNQGVVPGALVFSEKHARKFPQIKAEKNAPIFIYPKGKLHELCGLDTHDDVDYIKPFFKNSDIQRYISKTKTKKELLYVDGNTELPRKILTYLKNFKRLLMQRRECQTGKIEWVELQWARTKNLFEKPKIVVPYRCKRAAFAYNEIPFYAATDVYYITEQNNDTDKLKALLGILNSTLINVWLYHRGKRKGETLELFPTSLEQIPIILPNNLRPLVNLVTRRLKSEPVDAKIDALVYKLYGLTDAEAAVVEERT